MRICELQPVRTAAYLPDADRAVHGLGAVYGSTLLTTKRGRDVAVRLVGPDDVTLLVDLFQRLSERTRWLRFATFRMSDDFARQEAVRVAHADAQAGVALVGVVNEAGQERAVALAQLAYLPQPASLAEVAVVVRDDYQHEGLGKAICQLMLRATSVRGIRVLQAFASAENHMVYRLIRSLGLSYNADIQRGEMLLTIQVPGD